MRDMNFFAIHHTSVAGKHQLTGVNNYHRSKWSMKSLLGWYVGYNYFIDGDGTLTYCRKVGEETMAQIGHNLDTISVCLAGNFSVDTPSEAQIDSLRRLYAEKVVEYPKIKYTLHRKLQANRTCPGKNITMEWLADILNPNEEEEIKRKELEAELGRLITILRGIISRLRSLLTTKQ